MKRVDQELPARYRARVAVVSRVRGQVVLGWLDGLRVACLNALRGHRCSFAFVKRERRRVYARARPQGLEGCGERRRRALEMRDESAR